MLKVIGITKDFTPPLDLRSFLTLNFRRGPAVRALDNVSFSLPQGSVLAVLGPNGAGKTTLLKIIATLILPEKGSVYVDGLRPDQDEDRFKSAIGLVVSSERSFYWRLTGRQNLEYFAAMYGLTGERARARISELFRLFKIDYQDKRFDSYSAGMQQKFGLIRALLHDPKLLLLDEPAKSLDYTAARDFKDFIKDQLVKRQEKTVLFTTHHMDEITGFADLFMVLHKGNISAFGPLPANPAEIFTRLTTETS